MSKKQANAEKTIKDVDGKVIPTTYVEAYPLKDVQVDTSFNARFTTTRTTDEHKSSIEDLAEDIKKRGVLSPIWVTKTGFLVAGFRRVEAARMAGVESVRALVLDLPKEKAQAQARVLNLVENVHRDQLRPAELSYQLLKLQKEEESLPTMSDLAAFVGLSQPYVSKLVKIAQKLVYTPVVAAWKNDLLPVTEADVFASAESKDRQRELWEARERAKKEGESAPVEGDDTEKKRKKKRKPAEFAEVLTSIDRLSEIKVGSTFLAVSDVIADESTFLAAVEAIVRWSSGDLVKSVFRFEELEEEGEE